MPQLIDLRPAAQREQKPLPDAATLTLEQIEDGEHGLRPEQGPFVVLCERGTQADLAARYLRADGLDAKAGVLADFL